MPITLTGATGILGGINSATAQASTSGTSIDFTGIPAGADTFDAGGINILYE